MSLNIIGSPEVSWMRVTGYASGSRGCGAARRFAARCMIAGGLAMGLAGCDSEVSAPADASVGMLTVDAAADWAAVRLGEPAAPVTVADHSTSTIWDVAFFSTAVMLNGGAAGPAGVEGYCVCQNRNRTNQQVAGLTPASELAAFEAVTAASIPSDEASWQSDALAPAIAGWYSYDLATHTLEPSGRVWKVRTADGQSYAKLRVTQIEGATQAHPGRVTFEFAVQPSRGASLGAVRTMTVDASSGGRVYVDLDSGAVTTSANWDLALEGYDIRVNGGVSGSGQAGAVTVEDAFGTITDASDLTDAHYRGDAYGGAFDADRWYRYNITGTDHQIWPTYDVYLIRRGSDVYKIQITGYYGPAGESRRITFRYAKLT